MACEPVPPIDPARMAVLEQAQATLKSLVHQRVKQYRHFLDVHEVPAEVAGAALVRKMINDDETLTSLAGMLAVAVGMLAEHDVFEQEATL